MVAFVNADAQLRDHWPPYAKNMLYDLCKAVNDGVLDPDVHKVQIQQISALGKHRSHGSDSASNTAWWTSYPELCRLFEHISLLRGSHRIMGVLRGAGHQGEGR